MTFINRADAGNQLAEKLASTLKIGTAETPCIVGLPRGGMPVALAVARKFSCPLELIEAKKMPYPGQPEFAIGAVSAEGIVVLNDDVPGQETLTELERAQWHAYVEEQRNLLLALTKQAEAKFYQEAGRSKASLQGKIVIIVDDGIATGMTALAAIETAKKQGAARVILAAPVMSKESVEELKSHCDAIVSLSVPDNFRAVGLYYQDFSQTLDEEVVEALKESATFVSATSQAL